LRPKTLGLCLSLLAAASGCDGPARPAPAVVRFSALPDQTPDRVLTQHKAVVEEVCRIARVSCAWVPAPSYHGLVAAFGRGEIDVAFFGGVTFAQARHRFGAVPLAMRDIDFAFTSVILVRAGDSAQSLADLGGRSFAFGDSNSTSGHFMPRYYLQRQGLIPERAFAGVAYSGRHDATVQMIADGRVDAGAVNGSLAYAILASDTSVARRLRVLWRSPPFTDYVWAARPGLDSEVRRRIRDAFLDFDLAEPAHRAALEQEGAGGYVPADPDEFDQIGEILRERGRL
jgi:phosphonate transport system substrate-binding protein